MNTPMNEWLPWQCFILQHRANRPTGELESWLREENSLTTRLGRESGAVEVRKTRQYSTLLGQELTRRLGLRPRQAALVREVNIYRGGLIFFSARTYIPKSSLVGETRRLRNWQNRSLGDFLFRYPRPRVSDIEYACFVEDGQLLWGRRRCHYLYNRPIMVCEFFPDSSQ